MFHNTNTYMQSLKTALQRMLANEYKVIIRADLHPVSEHDRRLNAPNSNEVSVIILRN
jgi:hypothetical protein